MTALFAFADSSLVELIEGEIVVRVSEAGEILLHRGRHGRRGSNGDVARLRR